MKILLLGCLLFYNVAIYAQTSDDAFKKPLKEVLEQIQRQYKVTIRYTDDLVKDRWVTYAGWRFRPDVEKTMQNILASQDITFTAEGEKKYKLQQYQYHLKTPEEGREQLAYFSTLYHDLTEWNKRKAELKKEMLAALRLTHMPAAPASRPITTPVRKFNGYTVQNIAIETLPGVYVCGSLYKPANSGGKLPVVIKPDRHFARGR
jgi:hypothetical protein